MVHSTLDPFPLSPMTTFFSSLSAYGDWSLLALRIAVGAVFLVHGLPKLKNPGRVASGLGMSAGFGTLLGLAETLGGAAVLIGLWTQLGALALAVVMLGALYFKVVQWNLPFSATDKMGWEFDLALLASALVLMTLGSGTVALDPMFGW